MTGSKDEGRRVTAGEVMQAIDDMIKSAPSKREALTCLKFVDRHLWERVYGIDTLRPKLPKESDPT